MACITLMVNFTACSEKQDSSRQVIEAGDKKITLIKDDNTSAYNEPVIEKISPIKEVRAFDWIDEDTIIISKENKEYPKIPTESGAIYPQNLYLYNLKTNKAELIIGSENSMGNVTLSPDKKNVFYKEGIENLTGFILNLKTKQKLKVTKLDSIYPTEGQWVDNNNVVFSTLPQGIIYISDTKGNLSEIADAKGIASNTIKIKNDLYYSVGEKLYKQEAKNGQRKLLRKDVSWLIPSPDYSQFALVKHNAETKRTLTLTDLQGNELKTLAECTQIMGTSWSSDGSKLAYTVASESSGETGMFVADVKTKKVVQLAVDIQYISDSVKWSPSGKKLLASNLITEKNSHYFVSYIIDLKK